MKASQPERVQFRNVLFATDFSPSSEAAFPHALSIARQYDGILYVAHITTPDMYGYAPEESAPAMFEQIRRNARAKMAAFTEKQNFLGVPFSTLFGEGEVWDTIEKMLSEHSVDLIVVGTHGRRGLKKLVMGSVAEELVRVATRPVLTVGPECPHSADQPFRTVLYATDFSSHALQARDCAVSLAARFHAKLIALHVVESVNRSPQDQRREEERATARLRETLALDHAEFPIDLHVSFGHAAEEILRAASERKADVIVMSVRGAGAAPRLSTAFGSIAHQVLSQARCPVLTVRE
jgi:nucleotide-binding universal stress UspA family protein